MKTRGKFQCHSKKEVYWDKDVRVYEFMAVSNDGTPKNGRYHKYTPSGSLTITVDNPNVNFIPG